MFWRPAHELRGCRGYWFLSPRLLESSMSQAAARAIYAVFNLCPAQPVAANDKDMIRW